MKTIWSLRAQAAVWIAACALIGCSSKKQTATTSSAVTCTQSTKDTKALALASVCVQDDDCPCGGYCDLGVCAHQCIADPDCASGQRCDLHGRCRASNDSSNVAPPPSGNIGNVNLPLVTGQLSTDARRVDFTVLGKPIDHLRVQADPGLLVSCKGATGTFAADCELDNIKPGPNTVYAKSDPASAPKGQKQFDLKLISAVQRLAVGFSAPPAATPAGPKAGVFKGTLEIDAAGLERAGADQPVTIQGDGEHVTAKVFSGSSGYLVAVDDALHLLGDEDTWVFKISKSGASWQATAPTRPYLDGAGSKIVVAPVFTSVSFDDALNAGFDLQLDGSLGHANGYDPGALVGRYQLALRRTGDLAQGAVAPQYPSDAAMPDATTAALAPLPWEAAAHAALATPFAPSFNTAFGTLSGGPGLWQCESTDNPYRKLCSSAGESPCNTASVDGGSIPCSTTSTTTCATLQSNYGCTVNSTQTACDFAAALWTPLDPAKAPSECAQGYLCWTAPGTPSDTDLSQLPNTLFNPSLTSTNYTVSGDLHCASGSGTAALGYFENFDSNKKNAEETLDACAEDLDRYFAGPATPPSSTGAAELASLAAGSKGCIDGSRFEPALAHALSLDLPAGMGVSGASDDTGSAIGLRLLYQFASVQAFVAREALASDNLTYVLGGGSKPISKNSRTLDKYLDASLQGWNLVLHPRIASALMGVSPTVLAKPDYRQWVAQQKLPGVPLPQHEEPVGLPVMFAQALVPQLKSAQALIRRARYTGGGQDAALKSANKAARYAVAVMALSEALAARAKPVKPAWWTRWTAAETGAYAALQSVLDEAEHLKNGDNPLGISDDDLPLHYFGNPQDPGSRFSAISDFLLGHTLSSSSGNSAWAPAAVARAQTLLDAAQSQWIALRTRQLGAVLSSNDAAARLDGIKKEYGDKIINLCGNQSWNADTIIDNWTGVGEYTPNSCFIDTSNPQCQILATDSQRSAQVYDLVTEADAEVALCVGYEARKQVGSTVQGMVPNAAINQVLKDGLAAVAVNGSGNSRLAQVTTTKGKGVNVPISQLYQIDYSQVPAQILQPILDACRAKYPTGRASLPTALDLGDSPLTTPIDPNCVQPGALGDDAVAVSSAQQDLDIARQDLATIKDKFQIQVNKCNDLIQDDKDLKQLETAEFATMTTLRSVKLAMDITSTELKASAELSKEFSLATMLSGPGEETSEALKFAAGQFDMGSLITQFEMDTVSDSFDLAVSQRERQGDIKQCFDDADAVLADAKSAGLQAKKAAYDFQNAVSSVGGDKLILDRAVREGKAAVAAEEARITLAGNARAPLTDERWVNQAVTQYQHDFRLAQRMTYLAVRVVEYELQQSLSARSQVLAAQRPSQLRSVLDNLITTGAGSVQGKQPSDLVLVISLKNELLKLAGGGGYSQNQRFADYLAAHKVVDDSGNYLGVAVPFTLAPTSPNAPAGSIKIFTNSDCAERLWSVSASVTGDKLWVGNDPSSFVRLDLQKSNTFFSQWCGTPSAGQPFQQASIYPSVNLFADPALGSPTGIQKSSEDPASAFSTARMRAFLNVSRADLEKDSYADGNTSELAARGLYGKYKIFISKDFLSDKGSPGLKLDNVDDILLRLEYVSVAK